MRNLMLWVGSKWVARDRERGAALTEYGILLALIAAVVIGVITTLGTRIQEVFQQIVEAI
jgi:pilus assembly protein Flp/PilA